jgi:MATE family multidrug resistance protein
MPRPSLGFALLGIAVLFPLGWVLLFVLGLGAEGMGLAMTLTAWVQFLGFVVFIRRSPRYRDLDWASGKRGPDGAVLWGLFRLGGPMAVSLMMESGLFNSTALVIGRFGEVAVAGHQIALSIASVTFMVPLGFAIATTVRVGNAVGQGDYGMVRRAAVIGLALALASQVGAAGLMLSMPGAIAGFYASDPDVVAFGAGLLFLAALFQLSDGAQVVAAAALRGLKDARVPMLVTAVAYWGVGMPVGLWLTFGRGWQAPGMWGGLIAGLSVAAVLLWWRFARLSRRLMLR